MAVTATAGAATTTVSVEVGQPDAVVDPRVAFAPETLVLHLEAAGTSFEAGPTAVTVTRAGQTTDLSQGDACGDCYSFDPQRRLLTVRLGEPGMVAVQ